MAERAQGVGDLSRWQIEAGTARGVILDEIAALSDTAGHITGARKLFVAAAQAGELAASTLEVLRVANARRGAGCRTASLASLIRWHELALGARTPTERIVALAPRQRGKKWTLTEDVAAALAKYRQPNKPSLRWCVERTCHEMGVDFGSLYARCRREIKKLPAPVFYVGRHTGGALKALQPFRRREFLSLAPNDVWTGDGHSFKGRVAHPDTGAPFVPEVTVIMDVGTRLIMGWSVSLSENCVAVSDALRHAVSRHGIPLIYYSDNGSGQANRMFDAPVTGILAALGIQHETGRPGNPQGRGVIERSWQTALLRVAKRFATYRGHGADRETLRRVSIEIDKQLRSAARNEVTALPAKLPSFAQFLDALEQEINSYNQAHRHSSLPKLDGFHHATPAEYFASKRTDADVFIPPREELAALFMPTVIRRAKRGEVRLWNGVYFHRDLMLVDGEDVLIAYDIHDASRVLVKRMSGELIAFAELAGNSSGYMPKPMIDQLREARAARRLQRVESKADDIRLELHGATVSSPPVIEIASESDAADLLALKQEMAQLNVQRLRPHDDDEDWTRYRRALALERRAAAGAPLLEEDARWLRGYQTSAEYRALGKMAEDFPHKLEQRAGA